MDGMNKAFLKVGKKTILNRLLDTLQEIFDEIVLVTRQPEKYSGYPVNIVSDIYEDRSSLTGVHAGLYHAKNEFSFVAPCDAPFLQAELLRLLINSIKPDIDVVIPYYNGYYEPLCAVYSKRCIPEIETLLANKNYRIYSFFESVNIKKITIEQIKMTDPEMLSFFNINTPDTLALSMKVLEEKNLF